MSVFGGGVSGRRLGLDENMKVGPMTAFLFGNKVSLWSLIVLEINNVHQAGLKLKESFCLYFPRYMPHTRPMMTW